MQVAMIFVALLVLLLLARVAPVSGAELHHAMEAQKKSFANNATDGDAGDGDGDGDAVMWRLINNTETNVEANSVRRVGVDSALFKYAAILASRLPPGHGDGDGGGTAFDLTLPPSILKGIRAKALILDRRTTGSGRDSGNSSRIPAVTRFAEFLIPPNASFSSSTPSASSSASASASDSASSASRSSAASDSASDSASSASFDHVLLLYRQIHGFTVYTLPPLFQFLGPPVGLLAFPFYFTIATSPPSPSPSSSSSSSPSPSPSLSLQYLPIALPFNTSIRVTLPLHHHYHSSSILPSDPAPLCAFFSPDGSIFVSNLSSFPNHCTTQTLGDFALIAQVPTPPSPSPSTSSEAAPSSSSSSSASSSNSSSSSSSAASINPKLVIAAVCIALAGLAIAMALAVVGIKLADSVQISVIMARLCSRSKNQNDDETLQMSLVGQVGRAPSAPAVRTKPSIEMDMADFNSRSAASTALRR